MGDKSQGCMCSRRRKKLLSSKRRERCKRLRQTLVCDQEEEFLYEPYLHFLHEEYSPPSSECDSEIELPWKDFAISATVLAKLKESAEPEENEDGVEAEPVRKASSGFLHLPWEELVVTNTVQSELAKRGIYNCDSALEIPWEDIMYDCRMKLEGPEDPGECEEGTVEIPWKDLLVPEDIVLVSRKRCPSVSQRRSRKRSKKCGCSRHKAKTSSAC